MADSANTILGIDIGASKFVPAFGITGFDYVGTFYGNTGDMARLMDSVRDRTLPAKMAAAGLQPAADCVNDLHTTSDDSAVVLDQRNACEAPDW